MAYPQIKWFFIREILPLWARRGLSISNQYHEANVIEAFEIVPVAELCMHCFGPQWDERYRVLRFKAKKTSIKQSSLLLCDEASMIVLLQNGTAEQSFCSFFPSGSDCDRKTLLMLQCARKDLQDHFSLSVRTDSHKIVYVDIRMHFAGLNHIPMHQQSLTWCL